MLAQPMQRGRATTVDAEPGHRHESTEDVVHLSIDEPLASLGHEDPWDGGWTSLQMAQVLLEAGHGRRVQRDHAGLLKLGLADQEAIVGQIGDLQGQRLRDAQTGRGEQADQRTVRVWPKRVGGRQLPGRGEELIDLG